MLGYHFFHGILRSLQYRDSQIIAKPHFPWYQTYN